MDLVVPSPIPGSGGRFGGPGRLIIVAMAAAAMGVVAFHVAQHSIAVVHARSLLPRWDLAAHLSHGWLDYHYLVTGQLHRLVWDLWLQGYWPPLLSIVQIPFYIVTGGDLTGGLWSSLVTFAAVGVTGVSILRRQYGQRAWLPAAVFISLLASSPLLLAYGTVTMTEMLGALVQLIVIDAYLAYRQHSTTSTARRFAVALSLLFFTKYNYFLLLIGPLVVHEWIEFTADRTFGERLRGLGGTARRVLTSPMGLFVAISALLVVGIVTTGGFETRIMGQRLSVRSIGNAGHIVLYIVMARVWFLHARGRVNWAHLTSLDLRVRPLLIWFVVPVTIWLAAPYPNHLRDFFNLVVNRPMGEATLGGGLTVYADALRTSYFHNEWVLAITCAMFVVAAMSYRRQSAWVQWLILAVPLQLLAITLHQTRFPRFLLLTVVLLCLVAAGEVGRWFAGSRRSRVAATGLAAFVLVAGLLVSRELVLSERFRSVAFELYTDSAPLKAALGVVRAGLTPADRVAVVGENNDLSPALFRWELGPPSGAPCFPLVLAGVNRQDLDLATHVLLLENLGPDSRLDDVAHYTTQRNAVLARIERGDLVLRQEFSLPDLGVTMRLYHRAAPTADAAACR